MLVLRFLSEPPQKAVEPIAGLAAANGLPDIIPIPAPKTVPKIPGVWLGPVDCDVVEFAINPAPEIVERLAICLWR